MLIQLDIALHYMLYATYDICMLIHVSAFGICQIKCCFIYLMFVCISILCHVFHGGPHGRIADRLNVFTH